MSTETSTRTRTATHAVYGRMTSTDGAHRVFVGSHAECLQEMARLGRGRWADLRTLPLHN